MKNCPFDSETALTDLACNNELAEKTTQSVEAFKQKLDDNLLKEFNHIDDLFTSLVTHVQSATVKKLYCPHCKVRAQTCP